MGARAWAVVVLLGVLLGLGAVTLVGVGPSDPEQDRIRPAATPARSPVLDVLHDWDRSRARAWAEGDPAALRRLYVTGSAAGRADVRLLRRYLARGLVVRRMAMQVLAIRVLGWDARRLQVVVTDRLARAAVVAHGHELRLPGDAASTRSLLLRRVARRWRMVAVRPVGPSPKRAPVSARR